MNDLSIMQRFADPELIKQMGMSDKMLGSLITTILGMGITFIVLALLWGLITVMTKVLNISDKPQKTISVTPAAPAAVSGQQKDQEAEGTSLIAVITAAIAASLQRPVQTIFVKNIRRSTDNMPSWARAAKQEQIDSRKV